VYKGKIFSLESIVFDQDKNALYLSHTKDRYKFILKINTTDNTKFASEPTLNDFLTKSGSPNIIDVRSLIDNAILNPDHKDVQIGELKDNPVVYVCDIGRLCISRETMNAINPKLTQLAQTDRDSIIPKDLHLENKEVQIVLSSTPKKVIRNCIRKKQDNSETEKDKFRKDYFLKYKSDSIVPVSITYIVMICLVVSAVLGVHLWNKDPFSDLWGFPIPQTTGMMGGGKMSGSKMSGGAGTCYIPTEVSIDFQKPDLVAFGKMAAFLFFIQTIIYGAINNNKDWIGVSITSLVLLGLVSFSYRVFQNVGFDDGITFSNMFLFSDYSPPAKIPALLMYLTFYTSFVRLASQQYKPDEIIVFVLNFLLFAFWGVGLVLMGVKRMTSPVFFIPGIVMLGLSIWYIIIMFDPPKIDGTKVELTTTINNSGIGVSANTDLGGGMGAGFITSAGGNFGKPKVDTK
jgi:hypothetical protein